MRKETGNDTIYYIEHAYSWFFSFSFKIKILRETYLQSFCAINELVVCGREGYRLVPLG